MREIPLRDSLTGEQRRLSHRIICMHFVCICMQMAEASVPRDLSLYEYDPSCLCQMWKRSQGPRY